MNNPFDYTPDAECREAFRQLLLRLETLKESRRPEDINFLSELNAGKMLGVMVAVDSEGRRHRLYAFSGQLGDGGFHYPGFVGPVFDYLQPDGHFKTSEADISRQNLEISHYEKGAFAQANLEYKEAKSFMDAEVRKLKEKYRRSKEERDARRSSGKLDDAESAAMVRQSQFEKAELHRLKKRLSAEISPIEDRLKEAQERLEAKKEKRRSYSEALQTWLFTNFRLRNARGEERSLKEIFADNAMKTPPSGAGECCAPKLLQAAYLRGWTPMSMAEYWYGRPKDGEVRIHGAHYPACRGKCIPILGWMLQGLSIEPPLESDFRAGEVFIPKIIFENRWFCIVDKPSGMLSVPGKSDAVSVQTWLAEKYGGEKYVRMVHRLDQDTSGLLVAAFDEGTYKTLQGLFAMRSVEKTYVALLEGDYRSMGLPRSGSISLPLSPDWLDRPRQRVDTEHGKPSFTDYEFTEITEEGRSRVIFRPHTGRTHQLRVHAAADAGLAMPIAGDRLYGKDKGDGAQRLLLHAHRLEFTFPVDGHHYCFESPVPF